RGVLNSDWFVSFCNLVVLLRAGTDTASRYTLALSAPIQAMGHCVYLDTSEEPRPAPWGNCSQWLGLRYCKHYESHSPVYDDCEPGAIWASLRARQSV